MPRKSLRPELNRIRAWVRQGRTDAWIAHQLEVTVQQIQTFKREQGLEPSDEVDGAAAVVDFDDEVDLRAEDDALIAAELDAAEAERAEEEPDEADEDEADDEESDDDKPPRRRRGRRGGRGGRGRGARLRRSRRPSTTAMRGTACGSIPPSRMTRSMPSTGPVTGRSRSRSRKTRS